MLELYAVVLVPLQRPSSVKYELRRPVLSLREVFPPGTLHEVFYLTSLNLTQ